MSFSGPLSSAPSRSEGATIIGRGGYCRVDRAWERWRDLDTGRDTGRDTERAPEPTGTVTVPDVCGLTWDQTLSRLSRDGWFGVSDDAALPPFDGEESSDVVVVDQKPDAGERVAPHAVVTLWLRRGPGSAGMPAPLNPPPDPRARRGAIDETSGESVR